MRRERERERERKTLSVAVIKGEEIKVIFSMDKVELETEMGP